MPGRVRAYVGFVAATAVVCWALLYSATPDVDPAQLRAAAGFVVIGLLAHAYRYRFAQEAAGGSISFLPFLTALVLSPSWAVAGLIGLSVTVAGSLRQPGIAKVVFNAAQTLLAATVSAGIYRALGGRSIVVTEHFQVVAHCAMVFAFIAINTTAVSGVVAISSGQSIWVVWRKNTLGSLTYDLMATPVVYFSALVYNRFALAGVAFLGVLLVGARELYRTNRQLQTTNSELLELIVAAIDARDPYTSGHSQRVSHYSVIISNAIGLATKEVERIKIAGLLHDVGKIHEMFAPILQKPGRLTVEERVMMELHPIKGAELVAKVSELSDIVSPVRHHHENWDGSGYPDRIIGESIPVASRIIMFADTIDAMTTDRPYRKALTASEVRAELIKFRGRQFDPWICDRLLASAKFNDLFTPDSLMVIADTPLLPDLAASAA